MDEIFLMECAAQQRASLSPSEGGPLRTEWIPSGDIAPITLTGFTVGADRIAFAGRASPSAGPCEAFGEFQHCKIGVHEES